MNTLRAAFLTILLVLSAKTQAADDDSFHFAVPAEGHRDLLFGKTPVLRDMIAYDANDREIPGGDALAARAHVASPEAWENVYEAAEARGLDVSHVQDEDEGDAPPLQTLLFWSEQWRDEHGYILDGRPTIASEVNFIRWCLPWAWDNEPHFGDLADDVRSVVTKLEAILAARAQRHPQPGPGKDPRGRRPDAR